MISVEGLKVEFGVKPLFQDASFVINPRDRIALVGKNGAGKSTMLKILCGQQRPTAGTVSVPTDSVVGYLPQVMNLQDSTTVREEAQKAFANISELEARVKRLEQEMAERTDYESDDYMALVERYTTEHERLLMMGVEGREAELERTLTGLGFERTDLERPTSEFSGGWRMRIELAKILLMRPDVLLLDEPTNHLDIESIQWLEQWLAQSSAAVVLVSHDRAFINNVSNRTLEISCGRVIDYKVKYNEYVVLRQERREQQLRAYENQQKEIQEMKDFIERFRYKATKAVQVQQKVKQLEKIVPIEIDEVDNSAMHLKFPPCLRSGDYPVICEEVRKVYQTENGERRTERYDYLHPQDEEKNIGNTDGSHNGKTNHTSQFSPLSSHLVFDHVNLTIKRGEKVAFVGKNGEGKSTLVKCIMGEIPFDGNLKIGHNVQIGYFAQNQAQLLDESLTVYDTIDRVAKGEIRLKIKNILGAFMFGGEESDKYVKVLSGGERSRLAMIRLLLEPVNLLILDEPTNHLDMASKDVLKEAIRAFDGTAIIVSHDREFLDGLVTKVYEFGGGKVREYLGGIYDWIEKEQGARSKEQENSLSNSRNGVRGTRYENSLSADKSAPESNLAPRTSHLAPRKDTPPSSNKQSYAEHKEQQKRRNKAEKAVKESEQKIEKMEAQLKELDALLCDPQNASDMTLVTEYTTTKQALDEEVERWEELSETLEQLTN